MWQMWLELGPLLIFLALGLSVGRLVESRHFKALARREQTYRDIMVTNLKRIPDPDSVREVALVSGDAVISTDYFKSFAAKLRGMIGGEIKAFETLMHRARWEAKLRMLEKARQMGAAEVWNVRFETSNIRSANRNSAAVSVEVFAFGTAVVRR